MAASITAAVAVTGRPSASSGTNMPAAEALLAASGPATPSIAPWPNSSLALAGGDPLLGDVGQERRDLGAAGRQRAEREADAVPRSHGFHERFRSSRLIHGRPTGMTSSGAATQVGGDPERLAEGEDADRDDDDVDAVRQLRLVEAQPRLAGVEVEADQADGEAEEQRDEAAQLDDRRARW